jgi:hypothetical protein
MSDSNGLRPGMGLTWLQLLELMSPPTDDGIKATPLEKRLEGLSAEEILAALPPEVKEALRRELKGNGPLPSQG